MPVYATPQWSSYEVRALIRFGIGHLAEIVLDSESRSLGVKWPDARGEGRREREEEVGGEQKAEQMHTYQNI